MMDKLTVEQRCAVAREVAQQPWKYLHGSVILDGDEKLHYWSPNFEAEDWMRSQALELVEWLADHGARITDYDTLVRLASETFSAITRRDIPAIESLVHELLEPK